MFNILVVDDSPDDRNGLMTYMPWDKLSCTAVCAENGSLGLEKALSMKPDIVITDISMPIMDGIEMTKAIKKELPETSFIYMSYFDNFDFAVRGIEHGVAAYVLKPVIISDLTEKLKALCEKVEEKKELDSVMSEYKKQLAENRDFLIERFLTNHLTGVLKDNPNYLKQADFFEINHRVPYMMALFMIDNTDSAQNAFSMLFHLKKLITQRFAQY